MDLFPLKKTVIYLDLSQPQAISSLERKLADLGAIVEKCFGKDVTHLITDRGKPADYGKHSPLEKQKASSMDSAGPSPFNSVTSGWFNGAQDNSPIPGSDTARRPMTRAEAILSKANVTRYYGSSNVIDMARRWKIKIIHIKPAEVWIQKQMERVETLNCTLKQKQVSMEKRKVKHLTGIYIKGEDVLGKYRPFKLSFATFPRIKITSVPNRGIPFVMLSSSKASHGLHQKTKLRIQKKLCLESNDKHKYKPYELERDEGKRSVCRRCRLDLACRHTQNAAAGKSLQRLSKQSLLLCSSRLGSACSRTLRNYRVTQLKKYSRRHFNICSTTNKMSKTCRASTHVNQKSLAKDRLSVRVGDNMAATSNIKGFCEICDLRYRSLFTHLQSVKHQKFVNDPNNYTSLDQVITEAPSLAGLIADYTYHVGFQSEKPIEAGSASLSQIKGHWVRRSTRRVRPVQQQRDCVKDSEVQNTSIFDKDSSELPFCGQRTKSNALSAVSRSDRSNSSDVTDSHGERISRHDQQELSRCFRDSIYSRVNDSLVSCSKRANQIFHEESNSCKPVNSMKVKGDCNGWIRYTSPAARTKVKLAQPVKLLTTRSLCRQFKDTSDLKSFHGFCSEDSHSNDLSYTYQSDMSVLNQDFSLSDYPNSDNQPDHQPIATDNTENVADCSICEFKPMRRGKASARTTCLCSRSNASGNTKAYSNVLCHSVPCASITMTETADNTIPSQGAFRDSDVKNNRGNASVKSGERKSFKRVLFGNKACNGRTTNSERNIKSKQKICSDRTMNSERNTRNKQSSVVDVGEAIQFNFSSPQSHKTKILEEVSEADDICFNFDSPQNNKRRFASLADVVSVEENMQFNFSSPQSCKQKTRLSGRVTIEQDIQFNFSSPQSSKKKRLSAGTVQEQENILLSDTSQTRRRKQINSFDVKSATEVDVSNSKNCTRDVHGWQVSNVRDKRNEVVDEYEARLNRANSVEINLKNIKSSSKRMTDASKGIERDFIGCVIPARSDICLGDGTEEIVDVCKRISRRTASSKSNKQIHVSSSSDKKCATSNVRDCEGLQPVVILRRLSQHSDAKSRLHSADVRTNAKSTLKSDDVRTNAKSVFHSDDVRTNAKSMLYSDDVRTPTLKGQKFNISRQRCEKHKAATFFNMPDSISKTTTNFKFAKRQRNIREVSTLENTVLDDICDTAGHSDRLTSTKSKCTSSTLKYLSNDAASSDTVLNSSDACDSSSFNPVAHWKILRTLSSSRVDWSKSDSCP